MSTRSKSKRSTPRRPTAAPKTTNRAPALEKALLAQKRLDKNADLFRQAQAERRTAVQRAFQSGVSVQLLADELGVSRAKLYELLGGVRSSKTDRSPRAAV